VTAIVVNARQWNMNDSTENKGEKILLVDDLPGNLLVYQTILEELGQNLVFARSGEEALKLVLKQEFAVILLDVNMPTMDGFETAALIRQRKKSARTPIIFLTAFTDEVGMTQSYATGAVDYLPTPVVPEVLKAKVRVFIELSQMRRQAALQTEERVRREAAEESAKKSAFLGRVSGELGRSQSQAEFLRILSHLPVPEFADIGIAWLQDVDGAGDKIESSLTEPPDASATAIADFPWLEKAARGVIASGQVQLLDMPLSSPVETNISPLFGSIFLLPLAVRGKTQGCLVLARKRSGEPYLAKDIPFANDFACRVGAALENVLLLERIQENDRRKDEFLGMLAHELRNPLAPIFNAVQLQKLLSPDDVRQADLRDVIDRQAKHMSRLIDDLLDATRLAHGKILLRKQRSDLCKIVHQTVEDYRTIIEASGLTLNFTGSEAPLWIEGDPTRLVQAVGNLLHNAHKFTKSGGTISVQIKIEKNRRMAKVVVSDTGIGIDSKMLSCVFDVFRQAEQGLDRSRGGLGLGLALVKGLTQLHGGEVEAASDGPDKGSRFTIKLPVEPVGRDEHIEAQHNYMPIDRKYRILVIEDNIDAARSAQMLLNLEGHEVKMAQDAASGMELAQQYHPEIILCDIGLPGVDGYQLVRTLRQESDLSDTYIVALTGYGREQDRAKAMEAGFDLHLTKPIDLNNLRQALTLADTNYEKRKAG
jgi:CheY-like chemotaxis protein